MIAYRQLLEHFAARALEAEAEEVLEEADWSTSDPVELTLRAESERLEALLRRLDQLVKTPPPEGTPIRVSTVIGDPSPGEPLIVRPAMPAGFRPPTPAEATGPGVASVYRPSQKQQHLPALVAPPKCTLPVPWTDRPQLLQELAARIRDTNASKTQCDAASLAGSERKGGTVETPVRHSQAATAASIHPGLANLLAVIGIMLGLAGVALLVSELLYWL